MSNTCCALVRAGSQWHRIACGKTAKVEHEGKWYCGIHDPVKKAAKDKEREAKWKAQWELDAQRNRMQSAAPELYERLQATTDYMARWQTPTSFNYEWQAIIDANRAALAKAKP
jgi:uncharacterized Zn finger protein (UPF0148 family)